jgi:hypothetical protein
MKGATPFLLIVVLSAGWSYSCARRVAGPHLYEVPLSNQQIDLMTHFDIPLRHNSAGTCLRMPMGRRRMLLAWTDGRTSLITVPSPLAWLDDANTVRAWQQGPSRYVLSDGTVIGAQPDGFRRFSMVPSGRFFLVCERMKGESARDAYVFATSKPQEVILQVPGKAELLEKDDRLLVFLANEAAPSDESFLLDLYRIQPDHMLELTATVQVPGPWLGGSLKAIDISPFADEVLFLNERPARQTRYFTYNWKTGKLRFVGHYRPSRQAVFLERPVALEAALRSQPPDIPSFALASPATP